MKPDGLKEVLNILPEVRHAFAYGSAVWAQPGLYSQESASHQLVDFIMAVDNTFEWHEQNIARNRRHYSCLANWGAQAVLANSEQLGAGVHFNTAIPWGRQAVKYGIIGTERLCKDLNDWDSFYVSGRLQKPVLDIKQDAQVVQASKRNLASALTASLLLLPASFSLRELFAMVVGLSYQGDIRMAFAEDSRKVQRIVDGSYLGLQTMYLPLLQGWKGLTAGRADSATQWHQDTEPSQRLHLLAMLPANVLRRMAAAQGQPAAGLEALDRMGIARQVLQSGKHQQALQSAIAGIVRSSSRRQAAAGLLMAGGVRSATYLWQKMSKAWRRSQ